MSSLSNLLTQIMSQVAAIDGIKSVYDLPPEKMGPSPFAVVYPESGIADTHYTGSKKDLINVVVEVMVPRKNLARDVAKLVPYHDELLNALMRDPTFDGKADTFDKVEWKFGPLAWGETMTVGYRFIIRGVKIRTNIN